MKMCCTKPQNGVQENQSIFPKLFLTICLAQAFWMNMIYCDGTFFTYYLNKE